mmetsp:Transcript_37542/g.55274  ORF Transcript_37542/g.55274 Transcript_37542/m.55274 type:complete len:201 (-) Transcript_37542:697-1299(-)
MICTIVRRNWLGRIVIFEQGMMSFYPRVPPRMTRRLLWITLKLRLMSRRRPLPDWRERNTKTARTNRNLKKKMRNCKNRPGRSRWRSKPRPPKSRKWITNAIPSYIRKRRTAVLLTRRMQRSNPNRTRAAASHHHPPPPPPPCWCRSNKNKFTLWNKNAKKSRTNHVRSKKPLRNWTPSVKTKLPSCNKRWRRRMAKLVN